MRPNSGKIEPNSSVQVQVLLQAMKEDPPPDARCRDKFLVQSVAVDPATDVANIAAVWSNSDLTKSSVQEKKIRVTFLPADNASAVPNGTSSTTAPQEDSPPAYSSPSPSAAAVTPQRGISSAAPIPVVSSFDNKTGGSPDNSTYNNAASSIPSMAQVQQSIPTNQEDLRAQLNDAQATIKRLQADAADGLRQRKPQETAEKAVESVKQSMQNAPAPGGVPIYIVALLCLIIFIIAVALF